jgi:hypothetical protein
MWGYKVNKPSIKENNEKNNDVFFNDYCFCKSIGM